jgi:hypothetical protein
MRPVYKDAPARRTLDRRDREIGKGEAILAQEVDAEGVVVDYDELFGLLHRACGHLERATI